MDTWIPLLLVALIVAIDIREMRALRRDLERLDTLLSERKTKC